MFKNYLTVALRGILRQKGYTLINIVGLTVGITCCFIILLYVMDELSFDRHHKNSDRIYRLVLERNAAETISLNSSTPLPLAPALVNDFPQIAHAVRFLEKDNPIPLVSYDSKRFYERRFLFVDPNIFAVFTIPFVQGDPSTALQKSNVVVITEKIARKYFGQENPLGKTITFDNTINFKVTGVVKNVPPNSTIQFDFLASFSTLYNWLGKGSIDNWQNNMGRTYLLLSENISPEEIEQQLPRFIVKHLGETNPLKQIHLQQLNRIHLYSYQDYRLLSGGDIRYVYLLSAVAIFVLLIACINFINLATARSIHRSNEVGIRKVLGASKKQLVKQFLGEALFLCSLALLLAVLLSALILPHFNALTGKELSIHFHQNWKLWVSLVGIGLIVGLLSGSYPALFLSSFQPIHTLKSGSKTGMSTVIFRKALVVLQFSLTIALIIGTKIVYDQLNFMKNKRLGFDKDQVIVVPVRDQSIRKNPEPLKSRLQHYPGILEVGAAALFPGGPVGRTHFRAEGISDQGTMSMLWIDHDFIRVLGLELVAGRDFSKNFETDDTQAIILNEEAIRQLGYADPMQAIGKSFELVGSKKGTIIGVLRDFHFASLHRKIGPVVLHIWPWLNYVLVRVSTSYLPGVLDNLETVWHEFDPSHPFTFTFLDDNFDRFYQSEKQFGQVSGYFSLLAVLIACLGLFGLAAFTAEQRTKEIGIRKVLGASLTGILFLQLKEFIVLVFFANLIAWPIGYYVMSNWLQNFAYRIGIDIATFVLAGFLALGTALLTVSYQAVKAAVINPVDSLRFE